MRRLLKPSSSLFAFVAVLLLLIGAGLSVVFWGWLHPTTPTTVSNSETLRNVGLLIGGVLAFVFALWRGWVADRQATAAQRQADTAQLQANIAQQSLLNERYERGAEMLGSEVLSVRLAGIYALRRLAEEHPEQYHISIMQLFCAFVVQASKERDTSVDQTTLSETANPVAIFAGPDSAIPMPMDIQAVMEAIRVRSEVGIAIERQRWYRLGLSSANLRGLRLQQADLSHAVLTDADLSGAVLAYISLAGAWLDGANLSDADLRGTNLSNAVLVRPKRSDDLPEKVDRKPATGLTQEILDKACAEPDSPPRLDGVVDAVTGKPLVWRGGPPRKYKW